MGLPRYRCHKVVEAAKIDHVEHLSSGDIVLTLQLPGPDDPANPKKWMVKRGSELMRRLPPTIDVIPTGYLVVYAGGFESWSPAKDFDEGYTLITDTATERLDDAAHRV